MYSSHLLESDFDLATGKHTQMKKENRKGMKDLSASNLSHVSRKPQSYNHTMRFISYDSIQTL